MRRIEREANSNEWSEDILGLCGQDSFFFTAYRVYVILEGHGQVQSSSVPFIHRVWYVPLILVYVVAKRLLGLATRSSPRLMDHVFCCHSTAPYKTEGFFELVEHFEDQGEPTTLFATSGCRRLFEEANENPPTEVVTFGECFTMVSPLSVFASLPHLWGIARDIGDQLEVSDRWRRIVAFNFLVTEFIKYEALIRTTGNIESFHTMAPSPYQIESIGSERIYVHQHGIQAGGGNRAFSIAKYAPLTYFLWGEAWVEEYERKAHPDSRLLSVGSPRYDAMIARRADRSKAIDVLFVSGTQILNKDEFDAEAYQNLVSAIVETCETNGWELTVKLHPTEGPEWYRRWGYEQYITDESDIVKLLLQSDVAVTDLSSAFVESIVLGTPMIVAQCSTREYELDIVGEMEGLAFPETLDEAIDEMVRMKGSMVSIDTIADAGFIESGNSRKEIRQIVTSR